MFSGWVALTIFIIGGAITFSYKNPPGYKLIMSKGFNVLGLLTFGSLCGYLGMDLVITKLELPYENLGIHSYILQDYRYLWGIPLTFFIVCFVFSSIGSLTEQVKKAEE